MALRPINDRIIIRADEEPTQTKGGIHLPDSYVKAQETGRTGTVVAVGPGRRLANGERVPVECQPGDRILFQSYAGADLEDGGEKFLLLIEAEVIAVLPPEPVEPSPARCSGRTCATPRGCCASRSSTRPARTTARRSSARPLNFSHHRRNEAE